MCLMSGELNSHPAAPPPPPVRDHSRFNVTFLAVALYAIATVVLVPVAGLAIGYRYVFVWVLVGLAAAGVAAPRAAMRDLVRDWLPFFVAVATYDLLRGLADEWFAAHTLPLLYFDQWLFLGHVPTVWLQEHFFDASRLRVWDYVLYAVYLSHFVVPLAVAGVLWVRNRPGFRSFVARLLSLSYAAFVTYAVYPAVPPWLASANGDLAPTVRTQHVVWNELGFGSAAASFLESGNGVVNDVAAVPSLHAAFPMLILLFFWSRAGRWVRALLVSYVVAMGLALVYGGEHWVLDVLLGWAYAGVVIYVASRGSRWLATRSRSTLSRSRIEGTSHDAFT